MANSFDFTKLRRLITIQTVIQVFLFVLLLYMAIRFQASLQAAGQGEFFLRTIIFAVVGQLIFFYPIRRFAIWEVRREVEASATGLNAEQLKSLRTRRMIGDVTKTSLFLFFAVFLVRVPNQLITINSLIFYSFIFTYLSYFQCFNFAARREMKSRLEQQAVQKPSSRPKNSSKLKVRCSKS